MSWLRIDDEFPEHPKVLLLTDAALAFWVKVACWLRRPRNTKFDGFVPESMLSSISRKPAEEARELAMQLVNATAGGLFEVGLWIECEGGYRFHDWESYQPPSEKLSPQEAARIAGKRSAEARRNRYGSAQPGTERISERLPNGIETFGSRSTERVPEPPLERRSEAVRPNDSRTSRTPIPIPIPLELRSKDDNYDPKDLTGSARDGEVTMVGGDSLDGSPPTRRDNPIPDRPARAPGVPPEPRKDVFRAFGPHEWSPGDPGVAYARELGLSDLDIDNAITDLRNWKGSRAFTVDWWDLKWNIFVENRSKPRNPVRSQRAPKMGEPGWRRQPDAGAVNDADYDYDYSQDEVSNG